MKTERFHGIRRGAAWLAVLFATACGETAPLVQAPELPAAAVVAAPAAMQSARLSELSQPHTQTCDEALIFPPVVAAPDAIDFCRELVIIDPAVIHRLSVASFNVMMTRMFGTDVNAVIQGWADSWLKTTGDELGPREVINQAVASGWAHESFKLMAVVNRLDLAQNKVEIPRGEGRLIYQLFEDGKAAPMTVILEFDYPALATDRDASIKAWADAWHALGGVSTAAGFVAGLDALVGQFAVPDAFRRIRTNEALGVSEHWAFRQFDVTACPPAPAVNCTNALTWVELPHTPKDAYHRQSSDRLTQYLGNHKVVDGLREGTHRFGVRYGNDTLNDPDWSSEVDTGRTWVTPATTEDEALMLMAFNTCNGCHSDFKEHDVLPHISVQGVDLHPVLSTFMTGQTKMAYPLPVCRTRPPAGCIGERSPYYWSEQEHRVAYLRSNLTRPKTPQWDDAGMRALSVQLQTSTPPVQYRYH